MGNVSVISQPPSTFCCIRIIIFILNPFGHSSINLAVDFSWTGGVAPGGITVGNGDMSHLAFLPGWNSRVAEGAASLFFAFSPINSISNLDPALRFPLYCWFLKQKTLLPWAEDNRRALGAWSCPIGFENLSDIFHPPVTLWDIIWLIFILKPLGQLSTSLIFISSLYPKETRHRSNKNSFIWTWDVKKRIEFNFFINAWCKSFLLVLWFARVEFSCFFFKLFIKNNYSNDRNIIYKNFTYDNDNDKSSNID